MNMPIDDQLQQTLAALVAEACQAPPDNVQKLIEKKRSRLAGLIFSGNTSLDGYTMICDVLPPQGLANQKIAEKYQIERSDRPELEKFRGRCLSILLEIPAFRKYYRVERGRRIQKILAIIEKNVSIPEKYEEAFSLTRTWFIEHLCEYDPEKGVPVLGWFNVYYRYRKRDADQAEVEAQSRQQSLDNKTPEQVTSLEDKVYRTNRDCFERNEVSDRLRTWLAANQEELEQIFTPGHQKSLNAYIVLKEIIPELEAGSYSTIGNAWKLLSKKYPPSADRFRTFFNQQCKSFLFEYACDQGWISWIYHAEIGEILQRDEDILKCSGINTADSHRISAYELIVAMLMQDMTVRDLAQHYGLEPVALRKFWNKECFPYLETMGQHLSTRQTKDIQATLGCLSRVETQEWVILNEQMLRQWQLPAHSKINAYTLISDHHYPKYKTWDQLSKQYNVPSTILENFYQDQCLPFLAQIAKFLKAKESRNWIRKNQESLNIIFWTSCPHPTIAKEDINSFELLKRRIIHFHKSKDWNRILRELKLDREAIASSGEGKEPTSRKIVDVERLQKYRSGLKAFYRQQCLPDFFKRTEHLRHTDKAQDEVGTTF